MQRLWSEDKAWFSGGFCTKSHQIQETGTESTGGWAEAGREASGPEGGRGEVLVVLPEAG